MVVTGMRASLADARGIKRESLGIVDAVLAEDIGKLPDASVGEAMQRISGVQIARDRGESGSIAIRGLTQIETTLNGREIFTAGSGRLLDFSDLPAELVSGIRIAKTASAEQIEGGLGGLVDIRTWRPFDFGAAQRVLALRQVHGSAVDREKTQFSLLTSDRWQTAGHGEFGVLFNLAVQERAWREDQKSTGSPVAIGRLLDGQTVVAPNGTSETISVGDRKRSGAHLALQWQPSEQLSLYAEGSFVELLTRQDSWQFNAVPYSASKRPTPSFVPGTATLFGSGNDLRSIVWTNVPLSIQSFARDTVDRTHQVAVGGEWSADRLRLRADVSHTGSYNRLFFSGVTLSATAPTLAQDLSPTVPAVSVGGTDLGDPANYRIASLNYRYRPFAGSQDALALDAEYRVARLPIDRLSFGARIAKRHADNGTGLIVGDKAVSGSPAASSRDICLTALPYGGYFSGTSLTYLASDPTCQRDAPALRAALGVAGSVPSSGSPPGVWRIDENTSSGYAMATLDAGSWPVEGQFGVRLVHTATTVAGNRPAGSGFSPVAAENAYTDVLPSLGLRYELEPSLLLRFALAKTLTRPNFDQLSPSLTLLPNAITPALNQGLAGNPALKPIRADNLDLGLEKYFARDAAVYVAAFLKKVDGFIATQSRPETHDGAVYQVSQPYNLDPADIRGLELGYHQFFDGLPGWLRGLGMQANYTFVDSRTPDRTLGRDVPLQNLSRHSVNLVGMYERGPWSGRLAWNWRDTYLSGVTTLVGVGALPIYTRPVGWLDASLSWRLNDRLTLAIEGLNLLRTVRTSYYGTANHPQSVWRNDSQYAAVLTLRL